MTPLRILLALGIVMILYIAITLWFTGQLGTVGV